MDMVVRPDLLDFLLLKPAKLTQVADRVINENVQLHFVVILVVLDILFSTLLSETARLVMSILQ